MVVDMVIVHASVGLFHPLVRHLRKLFSNAPLKHLLTPSLYDDILSQKSKKCNINDKNNNSISFFIVLY